MPSVLETFGLADEMPESNVSDSPSPATASMDKDVPFSSHEEEAESESESESWDFPQFTPGLLEEDPAEQPIEVLNSLKQELNSYRLQRATDQFKENLSHTWEKQARAFIKSAPDYSDKVTRLMEATVSDLRAQGYQNHEIPQAIDNWVLSLGSRAQQAKRTVPSILYAIANQRFGSSPASHTSHKPINGSGRKNINGSDLSRLMHMSDQDFDIAFEQIMRKKENSLTPTKKFHRSR